ncbi:MAG TPA: ATP-binding protein [Longimicrobiaceae bacterium]|nr:ATP-binding protein [Longimicrobiaceae bacterium]
MPRFSSLSRGLSLRTKVFFLFAGAALLIVVPTLVLIARAVEARVYERAVGELARADTALASNWRDRGEVLLYDAIARAVAPELREAWLEGDERRMGRVLRSRLDRDRIVLAADTAGNVLVGPEVEIGALDSLRTAADGTVVTFPQEGGAPIRLALWVAATDSGVAGVVGVGTRLGASALRDWKKDVTGPADIALMVGDSLIASTLPDSVHEELLERDLGRVRAGSIGREKLGGDSYQFMAVSLPTHGTAVTVLLFRPITNELRIATGIRSSLLGVGFAALILALVLALVVARIVSRPAQVLVEASSRLARGDYRAPLPPPSGDEIGVLTRAFAEMRSAIAEREARLRSAQAEMIHREKLAAMGRLVAQLSHEINNPIYNIQNCLEALERRGDPNDPNREFLLLAQEELSRMAALTRRMLEHSRPLSDAAAPLKLNTTVQRVLALAAPELADRGVKVEAWLERRLPPVVAHPDAIQQVLANLVNNAMDAMPGGGVLRVSTRVDADAVEVSVEDTGSGITEEQLPHIFEAFYTTKPGVRGLGLGLFVSEGIIRGHRGRIVVESRPGEGSRFTVRLPRETLDETLAVGEREEEASAVVG